MKALRTFVQEGDESLQEAHVQEVHFSHSKYHQTVGIPTLV